LSLRPSRPTHHFFYGVRRIVSQLLSNEKNNDIDAKDYNVGQFREKGERKDREVSIPIFLSGRTDSES
jgi:hypothetical protein